MIYLGDKLVNLKSATSVLKEKDVNFYDYDGTLLYSYTKAEALALTSLPIAPNRTGENLKNEGWNMSVADITERINKGMFYVSVGCLYHTVDGKTHIIANPDEARPIIYIRLYGTAANDTKINWGDGSSETSVATSITQYTHTYSQQYYNKDVDITITSTNGRHFFGGSITDYTAVESRKNKIKKIFLSAKSRIAGAEIFSNLCELETITLHSNILQHNKVVNQYTYWFDGCSSLIHLNVPNVVVGRGILRYCTNIKRASIPKLQSGYYAFLGCFSLDKCEVLFAKGTSTTNNTNSTQMYNTTPVKRAYIDEMVTNTSSIFNACRSLEKAILPSTCTTINNNIFNSCIRLQSVYIKATTPPLLDSALTAPNTFYKIYVPRASYNDYITASNWADIASHIEPYDFN